MEQRYEGRMLAHALEEIRTLAALVADLKRITTGEAPTPADLADAPLLIGWSMSTQYAPCLVGMVSDHPLLGMSEIRTSQVYAGDFNGRWARTYALDEIRTLESLVADLKRIAAGQAPTPADLEHAPLLVDWEKSIRLASCLAGVAVDHPLLDSQPVTTSQIWAANFVGQDGQYRWARTYSRWYRLGASRKELGEAQ